VGEFTPEDSPLGQWVTIWIAKHPFVLAVGETPPATEAQAGSAAPIAAATSTKRPTERVKPAPRANPNAVVWRTPGPPASPQAGDLWVNPKDEMELVYVAPGPFLLGSSDADIKAWLKQHPEDADDGYLGSNYFTTEQPQCRVNLKGYWVGRTEVTNAQYLRFVEETGHAPPPPGPLSSSHGWPAGAPPPGEEQFPVRFVSWYDAQAYCEWAGLRLPTELEWEKAARGADGRVFPWGNSFDRDKLRKTLIVWDFLPVGSRPAGASPYGCLDMIGGVPEWCADWMDPMAYRRYAKGDLTPPFGGDAKVLNGAKVRRGGGGFPSYITLRCAFRGSMPSPDERDDRGIPNGFRCARDAVTMAKQTSRPQPRGAGGVQQAEIPKQDASEAEATVQKDRSSEGKPPEIADGKRVRGPEMGCNWASQPPVIDGVAEMAEWMNVDSFNLPHGHFRVQNDLTNLYLLLEVTDDTTDDPPKPGGGPPWPDYFRLVWDVNGDGERTPNVDVMYGVRGDTGALALYRLLWEGATTTARETAATFARGFSSSPGAGKPHGYWEFALPLRELGFDGPPQREPGRLPRHVGLGLRVYSARPSFTDDIPPSLERDFHGAFEVFLALPPGGLAAPLAESAGAPQTPAPIQPRPKVVVKLSNEPGEVSGPANPSDDFEDGVIDVAKWEPHSLPGTNVEESGGRLMMTMGPTTEGVDRGGEVYSKWVLRGPFDVQVDYELIEWPDHNRASVGLFLDLTDDQWSLQRLSARVGTWDGTDETYCTHFSSMHGGKCEGMMATSHRKGTLRLIRDEGSVLSAYVRSPENDGWMLVNSAQMPQVDAKPLLALFGELDPRTVKVAFDTFRTNRGQVVPPGTPTDEQPETRQQRNP